MKKILFVIDSITCGGAERGLVALLKKLDYSKYDVDLLYFCHDNEYYLNDIPPQVHILEPGIETQLALSSQNFLYRNISKRQYWPIVFLRLWFGIMGKLRRKTYFSRRVRDWKKLSKYVPVVAGEYDVAIAYLEGNPLYFTIDKVKADSYIVWQRTDYKLTGYHSEWDFPYFKKADKICVLSEKMEENFLREFPKCINKVIVFPNLVDIKGILDKSQEKVEFDESYRGFRIVSVGTLRAVKGYDVAMQACRILLDKGYQFKWYVLGFGEEEIKIKRKRKRLGIEDNFLLIGNKRNPYPYITRSDLFVQCSYREGFSTTVFEAKCLQKPIVITAAPGMKEQIVQGINGLIVPIGDYIKLAGAISKMIDHPELRERFSKELEKHIQTCKDDTQAKLELFDKITEM